MRFAVRDDEEQKDFNYGHFGHGNTGDEANIALLFGLRVFVLIILRAKATVFQKMVRVPHSGFPSIDEYYLAVGVFRAGTIAQL